jgi:hypothetical protein
LVPVVLVDQGEPDQLSSGIRHRVVSVAEFIGISEPVPVYGFTHESTGILPQAFIQKPVRAQYGKVVHYFSLEFNAEETGPGCSC